MGLEALIHLNKTNSDQNSPQSISNFPLSMAPAPPLSSLCCSKTHTHTTPARHIHKTLHVMPLCPALDCAISGASRGNKAPSSNSPAPSPAHKHTHIVHTWGCSSLDPPHDRARLSLSPSSSTTALAYTRGLEFGEFGRDTGTLTPEPRVVQHLPVGG